MTPTRELAVQVMAALKTMLANSPQIKTAVLIGGEPMPKQFTQLKQRPRLVVGTPGRINDHLDRGTLMLNEANFLVLDETDRMLDMGFGIQIDRVLKFMPKQRQTLMFSATLPPYIIKMSKTYMNNPERVSAGEVSTPVLKIEQETVKVQNADKYTKLAEELDKRTGSVIIFVKTKHGADKLAYRLIKDDHEAEAIHGDLRQNKRDKVIKQFRDGKHRILVATDVAARGLDIPHIEHVINFDLPQVAEDYIHRIGRTGRNGAEGKALNFVSGEDGAKWKAIQRLLNPGEKPAYDNDDAPQQRSGGNRSRPSSGGHRGSSNGPSNGYAKKRPFGARADGSRDNNRFEGRSERPQQERSFSRDRNDAPRSNERSNDRYAERSERPAPRSYDRDAAPRSFDRSSPRPERSSAPRFENSSGSDGNRRYEKADHGNMAGRTSNGDRKRHEGGRNGNGNGGGNFAARGPRPEGRSDAPRFEGRSDRPANRGPRPEGRSDNRSSAPRSDRSDNRGNRSDRPAPRSDNRGNGSDKPKFFGRSRAA